MSDMFLQNPLKHICQYWTVLSVNTSATNNEWTCFLHLIHHTNLHHTPLLLHLSYSESVLHHLPAVDTQKSPKFASILQRSPTNAPFTPFIFLHSFMPQPTALSSFRKSFGFTGGNGVRDPGEGNSWGLQAHGSKMWAPIVLAHGPYYLRWSFQLCCFSGGGLIQMLQMLRLVILKVWKHGRLQNVVGGTQDSKWAYLCSRT